MNFSIIKRTIGWILLFEGVFLLVPLITALVYGEQEGWSVLISLLICLLVGGSCLIGKLKDRSLYAKEGITIVALSWIVMSLFGALPFFISGAIPSFIDSLFETVSGFTTTGATILPSGEVVEGMPKCLLMWRSFTHWVGGMGVLVFIMAFLPLSGAKNMHIMKMESPGPSVGKLVPKIKKTAKILYLIYTGFTVMEFVLLCFGDMTVFEALNTAFATAGTGGFGVKGDSMMSFSSYTQIVVTIFMLLFSINFNAYFFILCGKIKEAFNLEIKVFLVVVFTAIAFITINLCISLSELGLGVGETIKHAAFSVASVVSTTGFSTLDFGLWPAFSQTILVLLMFMGACAGSTGGGMKVSRFVILYKGATREMQKMLHPKQMKKITMDGHIVEHEVVRGVHAYLIAFVMVFIVSLLLISIEGKDLITNFTAVTATINNIGPGLGGVGPSGNFAIYSVFSKIVFIFDMLAGRLEIFPMLLLFAPTTWKK